MPIAFTPAGTFGGNVGGGVNLQNPTSLQFGPDGRLYVSEQNGDINAFTVEKQDDTWVQTGAEVLTLPGGGGVVKSIQNHNDDGTESSNGNRQVTGVVVTEDDQGNIVLYVSSSDPRISSNNDVGLDTNSGVVSKVTQTATGWEVVDLVRGLPRSEENHSVNGMVLTEGGTKLLLQVGGFTNNGAPSGFFSYTNEYALSGAVLELDLVALDALPNQIDPEGGQNDTPRAFKYDLPTLDDPNIENAQDTLTDEQALAQGFRENSQGMDLDGPHGGNDGLNMAILPADAPLRLYADGLRNAYDLAQGANGLIYTVDNGSNGNLGAEPNTETNDEDGDGIADEAIGTPNNGGQGEGEPFHQIVEGGYYYHANPVRSNQNMAWTVYDNNQNPDPNVAVNQVADISALVPAQLINDGVMTQGFLIDPTKFAVAPGETLADLTPQEQAERLALSGVWINSNQLDDDSFPDPDGDGSGQKTIAQLGSSTNGIIVYDSGGAAFGGSIDGAVFVTQFNDNLTLLNVNDAGTDLEPVLEEGPDGIFGTADDIVQDADGILQVANNSLGVPLGNPLDVTQGPNGTLWVAEIGSNEITVLEPTVVLDPTSEDADFDGVLNKDDPFSRDATNGTSVTVTAAAPTVWEFSQGAGDTTPGPDGFGGGLTGAMINGETDFEAFYLEEDPNGNPGDLRLDNVKFVTAALGGTTTIEQVSNGDPLGATNDGEFLFHTGFVLDQAVETFTVSWNVANPAAITGGSDITSPEQQIGGYLGDGTQSNYLKFVAVQTSDGPKIRLVLEEAVSLGGFPETFEDQVIQTLELDATGIFDDQNLVTDSFIKLDLLVDLTAKTATPTATFETTSGPVTITGGTGDVIDLAPGGVNSKVLTTFLGGAEIALGEQQGIAAGLFSSNTGSDSDTFQAVFDSITVSATEAELPPTAVDDDVTTQTNTAIEIPVATLVANDVDANSGEVLTITGVSNAVNGTVALENGVVTFSPDQDFQGDATFEYTVEDSTGLTDTGSVTVSVSDLTVLFRLNAAGGTIAALPNDPYGSDLDWLGLGTGSGTAPSGTQSGFAWSVSSTNTSVHDIAGRDASVPDYAPQELFAVERWDPPASPDMQWTFGSGDLPSGTYTVNIFAGNGFGGTSDPGQRVFDINIEGALVEDNLDLSSTFGHQVGGLLSYEVQVTDGTLNVELGRDGADSVENPTINGIEVLQGAVTPQSPTVDIVSGDVTVNEADGTVQVSILASETVPNDETLTITYVITGVTAFEGADYAPDESLSGSSAGSVFTGTASIAGGASDVTLPITILTDGDAEPTETFTVEITSVTPGYEIGNGLVTVTIEDDDAVTQPGEIIYRVNPGGSTLTAADGGPDWLGDTVLANSLNGNPPLSGEFGPGITLTGGQKFSKSVDNDISGLPAGTGAVEALFDTERFGVPAVNGEVLASQEWDFVVDNGDYTVNLYFSEIFIGQSGSGSGLGVGDRIFDVAVEGALVLDDYDLFADVGTGTAVLKSFDATVADGNLDIDFTTVADNAKISAIEIIAAADPADQAIVSIAAPTPASVVEGGDDGVTTLLFPVAFDKTPSEAVTVEYSVDIDGVVTTGETLALGTSDGVISVDVPNDDQDDGAESVTVTLTAISAGATAAMLGTDVTASGFVTEDDTGVEPPDGEVVVAINAGGPALTQDGIAFSADQSFDNGNTFTDSNSGNGQQPVFDDTVFETERFGGINNGTMSYSIPVPNGDYTVELYFAEIFQPNGSGDGIGARVFDVTVEGQLVLDDFDILEQTGGDINQPIVFTVPGVVSPDGAGDDPATIDIDFSASVDNAKISAIVIRDANGNVYEPPFDDLFGTAVEIADTGDAPSGPVALAEGSNVMSATQEGDGDGLNGVRDRDYFTVEVPEGFQLTGVVLNGYDNANATAPDGFLAFQQGGAVTVDPLTGANVEDLQGAIIYGANDLDSNLLETMRAGFSDPQTGNSLPAFDQPLTGAWTFWLNQGAGPSTATLDFIVEPLPAPTVTLSIADAPTLTENGDADPTTLEFPLTASDPTFSGVVTITYDQDAQSGLTQAVSFTAGAGTLSVDVPSDDVDDGPDTVTVTVTAADDGATTFEIDAAGGGATGVVTEDDLVGTPNDIDGDGLANVVDPAFADPTNGLSTILTPSDPIVLDFETPGPDPFAAGFTGINVNPDATETTDAADPYGAFTSDGVVIEDGLLKVATSDGDSFDTNNASVDDYGVMFDARGNDSFSVRTTLITPADFTDQNFQAWGIQIGDGSQESYVKFTRASGGKLQVRWDDNDSQNNQTNLATSAAQDAAPRYDLEIKLDRVGVDGWSLSAIGRAFDGVGDDAQQIGDDIVLATPLALSDDILAAINAGQLHAGVYSTDFGNAPSFTAQWADFSVVSNDTPPDDFDVSAPVDDDTAPNAVAENAAVDTPVGLIAFADDPDAADTVSYSLTDDAGGLFKIDPATGAVSVAGVIDRETVGETLTIEVTATSTDGSSQAASFSVDIIDVDEFVVGPVTDVDAADNEVAEGAIDGDTVGVTAFAADDDATTNLVSYSLTDDADGRFAIDTSTGVVTLADASLIDFDTAASHDIVVEAASEDGSTSSETFSIAVAEPANLSALIEVLAGGANINASTFGDTSFQITNTGDTPITQVVLDLASGVLPDIVFDPNGTAGDSTAKGFTQDASSAATGVTPSFGSENEGGFYTLTLDFTDFQPGETLVFGLDTDPTSVKGQGAPGAGESGSVSGLEMVGAGVSVTFDSGTTLTSTLFEDGSNAGAVAVVAPEAPDAPTIELVGVANPSTVATAAQTILVTGAPGATVRLLQAEGAMFEPAGGGFDVEPFEANSFVGREPAFTGTLDGDGQLSIPVTLTDSLPEGGLNHFIAVLEGADGQTSATSNALVVELDESVAPPGGVYLANAEGNYVFEAESAEDPAAGDWVFNTTDALPDGHEAPTQAPGAGPDDPSYVLATSNHLGNLGGEELVYSFVAQESGFIRVNLVAAFTGSSSTDENDSYVGLFLDGQPIEPQPQAGGSLIGTAGNPVSVSSAGFFKLYSSGSNELDFILANKTFDNNAQPVIWEVTAGETYDFILKERSSGHKVDRIVLEFSETQQSGVLGNGAADTLQAMPLSPQALPGATISGRAFADANDNAIDDGEPGIAGLTVELLDASDSVVATTTTGTDGGYAFESLADGSYTVRFPTDSEGDPLVAPNVGDDTVDSDANPTTGDSAPIAVVAGQVVENVDAGYDREIALVGSAFLTVNDNSNNIQISNFGNGSFVLTNTGQKDITSFVIDVTDALYPDAVFDPFGLAGDTTGKQMTVTGGLGGATGVEEPSGGFYLGAGGVLGFEGVQLDFDQLVNSGFDPGESVAFAVDMDPNSIAGAEKAILDPGAQPSWDIGGISGAELIGSSFTVTFADGTTATGTLQGQTNASGDALQGGSEGLATQASAGLDVALTVNGVAEGGAGAYTSGGPTVVVNGPAGATARVTMTKGIIQPTVNNFPDTADPDEYHDQLDAQLAALAASDFPANNAAFFQTVDIELTGEDQDISDLFNFTDVPGIDLSPRNEAQLPLGFVAGVIDPDNGDAQLGPVSSPIHVVFTDEPTADLSLEKVVTDVNPDFGDQVVFTVTVTNDGPSAASSVEVADTLGSGFAFVQAEGSAGAYDDASGVWTIDTLAAGASETLTVTATVLETATPAPDEVVYRVNAGGAEVAAEDGGLPWSADTQAENSPFLTNAGSNNVFPSSGSPNTSVDVSEVDAPVDVIGIERWDNDDGTNGDMTWAFDVDAGKEVRINLYLAEVFTGLPDLDGSGDPSGDRIFDVAVDGVVPAAFDDVDPYTLAGNQFLKGAVVSHTLTSDGTIDLVFSHVSENPAIKGIEIIELGDAGGPLDYTNTAEVIAASTVDPDSTAGNGVIGEDDDATVTVVPVAGGVNLVTIAAVDAAAAEGSPTDPGQFVVTLEEQADADTTVTYTVGGTATAGSDYEQLEGSLVIPAGQTEGLIDLTVLDDLDFEGDESVEVTLTDATGDANLQLGPDIVAIATIADDETPPIEGAALIEITPDGGLDASTFAGSSFQITNTGPAEITQIQFDLSTGILPDMVFDPTGSGGDSTANPLTPNSGAALTGFVAPSDPAVDPFSVPRNGGFDVLTLNFTDFQQGEQFFFTTDVDPNNIQGVPGAGNAGAVSGYELIGSTVTITFSDGTNEEIAVSSLYDDGSLGGAQGLGQSSLSTGTQFAAPTIELLDGGEDESGNLPGDQQSVPVGATSQTVRVTGAAGANVSLLQMDTRLFIASGDDPFDVQPDELPFYANEAMSGKTLYDAIIGQDGFVDIPVTLLSTPGSAGTPDGGINHFVAVLSDGPYAVDTPTSQTSNTLVVIESEDADPNTAPTITSGDTFDFAENKVGTVFEATATDAEADDVTFSITGGDDQLLFDVGASGAVSFIGGSPEFVEGGDNFYTFEITASDGDLSSEIDVTVEILNDEDADGFHDEEDNAVFIFNPDQRDTNNNGIANIIDVDLDGDGFALPSDAAIFRDQFGELDVENKGSDADFDGDGFVGASDAAIFRALFGQQITVETFYDLSA